MTFAERLKHARDRRGLTQRALSEAAGMKPSYVAQAEVGGIEKPSHQAMLGLAKGLRVPLEWLFDGSGPEPEWDAPASERTPNPSNREAS